MSQPELSIIVPAYNEEDLIQSTLDGLYEYFSQRREQYEILVVDDGSHDKTAARVEEWSKQKDASLRLLRN